MSHLKRLIAPKSWKIWKKQTTFITRPIPGPQPKDKCMTPVVLLKEVLNMTKTTREVRHILHEGKLLINQTVRKDVHFPIGFMDIISFPDLKENYLVTYDKWGKFILKKIDNDQAKTKLCKVVGKTVMPKKKTQLNLSGGMNILVTKDEYKVGDTLKISLPDMKVLKHVKCEKGAHIFLIGGKHIGSTGKLNEIKHFKGIEEDRIIINNEQGIIETLKGYMFVITEDFI